MRNEPESCLFVFNFWLYWVFIAVLWLSLIASSRGYSLAVVFGLLIVVAYGL